MNDKEQKPKGKAITIKPETTPPDKQGVKAENDLARRVSPQHLGLLNAAIKKKNADNV